MMNGRNYSRSVPVQKPKVVSIPVHFVSSDQKPQTNISTLKHKSAVKIQKVFRGHTVRNSVKKIVSIKNEVNEIEKRLQNDVVFVKLLCKDAKERLRVNETLMSLLFKLDSVRGVDNGVRELRKSVAKKAVALQDKLDSIAQSFEHNDDDVNNEEKTEVSNTNKVNEEDVKEVVDDDVINGDDDVRNSSIGNKVNGEDVKEEVVDDDVSKNDQNLESGEDQVIDGVSNKNCDHDELVVNEAMNEDSVKECDDVISSNIGNKVNEEDYVNEAMNEYSMKECDDDVSSNVRNRESVENEQDVKEAVEKKCDDDHGMVVNEDGVTDEGRMKECGGDDDVSKSCCDKGMVEKLMCDNAKMMKLMIQISERNEMQTRMINTLSRRVEQLEKAFMSDKSRRRKKSSTRREKDAFCV